jgi:hypothetical protein
MDIEKPFIYEMVQGICLHIATEFPDYHPNCIADSIRLSTPYAEFMIYVRDGCMLSFMRLNAATHILDTIPLDEPTSLERLTTVISKAIKKSERHHRG